MPPIRQHPASVSSLETNQMILQHLLRICNCEEEELVLSLHVNGNSGSLFLPLINKSQAAQNLNFLKLYVVTKLQIKSNFLF